MYPYFLIILWSLIQIPGGNDFNKGVRLFELGKLSEAKRYFEKHVEKYPEHTQALEYLGDIAGKQKQWDEAILYYQKIKEQYPEKADYHYKYGGALGMKAKESNKFKALGMIGEVEDCLLTASKLDKKHVGSRWALVMLYLELPRIVGGSEKKAQKYANELVDISKSEGAKAKGYIEAYFKRYEKAEAYYRKAYDIEMSEDNFEALYDFYKNIYKQSYKAEQLKKEHLKKNT